MAHGSHSPCRTGTVSLPASDSALDPAVRNGGRAICAQPSRPDATPDRVFPEQPQANNMLPAILAMQRSSIASRGRHTKATLTVGSLNINGRGNLSATHNNKWNSINQLMRDQRIGILALQETHLDDDAVSAIHALYGRRLHLFNSHSTQASSAQGVTIVLNRELVDISNVQTTEIVPGRALLLRSRWHNQTKITILAIYAPNDNQENEAFWSYILQAYQTRALSKPDALLGDFNIVEEAIDRLPPHEDPPAAVESLQALLSHLQLTDGWRMTEPNTRDYSFPQRGSLICSRIDRIYVPIRILQASATWDIKSTGTPTDHKLILAQLSTAQAPYVGKGRWTLPTQLLLDRTFTEQITLIGATATREAGKASLPENRTPTYNPQCIMLSFKQKVIDTARTRLKQKIPKIVAIITRLTSEVKTLKNSPDFDTNDHTQTEVGIIQDRINELEQKRHQSTRQITSARYALNAERLSKYWSNINRERCPRDVFYSMIKPLSDPPLFETRSDKMAELARNYHENLQTLNLNETDQTYRDRATQTALTAIPQSCRNPATPALAEAMSRKQIIAAIKKSQLGKASGCDGIPYEFWKAFQDEQSSKADDVSCFDSLELLRLLFADIDTYGPINSCKFAEGWMCPIYKKGDRRDIANYRPITLLNTDYKIYTRILATDLGSAVSTMIHPNQAGFIPGRSISDQTQTCRTMVDYAEAMEENGVIIALDQEKAYDKIRHDYLWLALEAFGLPPIFIRRVQRLYENATTTVIINGELSSAFRITRGVRQGDPLSCLLFNLAIEPLACLLRNSSLRGFSIPGFAERLITTLFADDTSAFLSANDSWKGLWSILDLWCIASGAKFNNGKTEVIPIGTLEYRRSIHISRLLNPTTPDDTIPLSVHVARDGEATRILGSWIGNKVNEVSIWGPTIQKIQNFLDRWGQCHPSFAGKRHIIQMGPGGMTQYLTTVQGMPKSIEKTITHQIRAFLWGLGSKPPVSLDTMNMPRRNGGLDILDIHARNEAIDLTWLRRYLTLDNSRPLWAFASDAILNLHSPASAGAMRSSSKINTFLQDWTPTARGNPPLPEYLKRMLNVSKKYNASFAAIKLPSHLKSQLPIWYHIGANKRLKRLNNSKISDCLRTIHGIKRVADLLRFQQHSPFIILTGLEAANDREDCPCTSCVTEVTKGCPHPIKCREAAHHLLHMIPAKWHPNDQPTPDGLTLTHRRNEKNHSALENDDTVTFNPSITASNEISAAFRVFVDPQVHNEPPAIRPRRGRTITEEATTVFVITITAPSNKRSHAHEYEPGSGYAFYASQDPRNTHAHVSNPGLPDNKTLGILAATLLIAHRTPLDAPLHIVCETNYLPLALNRNLPFWEDRGWIDVPNAETLKLIVNILRQRCAITTLRKAKSHSDQKAISSARDAAERAHQVNSPTEALTTMNPAFHLSGARLECLTQRTAYRNILALRTTIRSRTEIQLSLIREHLLSTQRMRTSSFDLWQSIMHKDLRRPISDFIWKGIHGAHKCGPYWSTIPGFEDRADCPTCSSVESLDHILLRCSATGQQIVWKLTKSLWTQKGLPWPQLTIHDILGLSLRTWTRPQKAKRSLGAERLWRILISESAWFIWKLRCERRLAHIEDSTWQHSPARVIAGWTATLNRRLHLDMAMTHRRYGRQAIHSPLVISTWNGVLRDEGALPFSWTHLSWVLVGITPVSCLVQGVG